MRSEDGRGCGRARGVSHRAGVVTGERWEYDIDGKTVGFTIRNGKVERIDESR